jgi:hypothetical protein
LISNGSFSGEILSPTIPGISPLKAFQILGCFFVFQLVISEMAHGIGADCGASPTEDSELALSSSDSLKTRSSDSEDMHSAMRRGTVRLRRGRIDLGGIIAGTSKKNIIQNSNKFVFSSSLTRPEKLFPKS